MIKTKLSLFLIFCFGTSLMAQPQDLPERREPGKCYAKCLIADSYEEEVQTFDVYTGNFDDGALLDTLVIEIEPKGTKWIKRPADRNCLGNDPNDCLVWALVEVPAEYETIITVVPGTSKNFIMEKFWITELVEKGGFTKWLEVLCPEDVNSHFVKQLRKALRSEGYPINGYSNTIDNYTKSALAQFQKDNKIPVGNLNYETLNMLGIKY